MTTASVGIRSQNVIVPYVSTTKRTKELTLVKTTDLTIAFSGGTPGNQAVNRATAIFYADSAGIWRMKFNIEIICDSAGGITGCTVTFAKASLTSKSGMIQAITSAWGTATITGRAYSSTNTLVADVASSTITGLRLSGDIELNADPTDYTIAANMEGVIAADVYIAPAAAGTAGLVNNVAGNTVGTPILGRTDGGTVASGYKGEIVGATAYTGTGGATYATASTTVATHTNPATLLTLTLNKGVYIFGCTILQAKATDASLPELSINIKVGGTVVGQSSRSQFSASTDSYTTNRKTIPLVITADNTAVTVTGTMVIVNADARLAANECWAIRIA